MKLKENIFSPFDFAVWKVHCTPSAKMKPVMVCTAWNLATMAALYLARLDV